MYNQDSARKYGWKPQWFGVDGFGKILELAIIDFQKEHGLEEDGLVGPTTYRRIFLVREEEISHWEEEEIQEGKKSIVYNGNLFSIDWERVVLWDEDKGYKAKNYKKMIGKPRDPLIFINHWDVCLSSKSCQKVLDNRGLSVHFLIDNDGTIYQTMDIQHIAFHAGRHNSMSIGVEISNAYYPKYQDWYVKNGFGERPIWTETVRGKPLEEHLGFYDVQIKACQALWKAISVACDIPQRCPLENGKMMDRLHEPSFDGKWKGFIHHFHVSNKKIDCGGFNLQKYLGKK